MRDEEYDIELEEELRWLAGRLEPVPPALLRSAQEAFGWRDMDHELAELVSDSLLDSDEAMLVRSSGERRLVSFRARRVSIDVEVTRTTAGRSLLGQLTPPQPAVVEIRRRQGTISVEADELGRFRSGPLQPGPASLRIRPPASTAPPTTPAASTAPPPARAASTGPSPVATDWICL
jgi:hypothetical protein